MCFRVERERAKGIRKDKVGEEEKLYMSLRKEYRMRQSVRADRADSTNEL